MMLGNCCGVLLGGGGLKYMCSELFFPYLFVFVFSLL